MGASAACNNNLSEVVSVSHSLQKLLVFFMMLDAVWMVIGYSFFGPLLSFLFHFIVFRAVKNQRTGILLVYVVLNVIVLSFAAVGMLFLIGASMTVEPYSTDSSVSSSEAQVYYSQGLKSMISRSFSSSSSSEEPTPMPTPSDGTSSSQYAYSSSDSYDGSDVFIAGSIILLVSIIILYCKIYSVVLAARLRRLLLATPVLPVHVALPVDGVHSAADNTDNDTKPLLAEQPTYDEANQMFAHPGFVPMQPQLFYPNIQGGAPSMMPPPFMYGQHPVFYTFAPAPQPNEKQ